MACCEGNQRPVSQTSPKDKHSLPGSYTPASQRDCYIERSCPWRWSVRINGAKGPRGVRKNHLAVGLHSIQHHVQDVTANVVCEHGITSVDCSAAAERKTLPTEIDIHIAF